MTWFVKAKDQSTGVVYPILCEEPKEVKENYEDQLARGREVWIEDHQGKALEAKQFGIS